jgi:hypothetical protein
MSDLPIVHMTLYKHGVGYFQRRGKLEGESIKLTFRREEMDDLLKSLTVIDHGGGQVRGVDYDTPQSQAERLAGNSIILDDRRSLRDLLVALRGRAVQLQVSDGSHLQGILVGLDEAEEKPLEQSLVSLLQQESEKVMVVPLNRIEGVELRDTTAAADLRFFLQTALGQETHRSITIRLSPGSHDLEVSYIAPAPTWRVSYRLVVDTGAANGQESKALLQGWGIFDNRLEEDLTDISLALTAGMPVSFVYDLYTPHTPQRPVVKEEDRVAAGPILFEASAAYDREEVYPTAAAPAMARFSRKRSDTAMLTQTMAESVESAATGKDLGELFQYDVGVPVTVGRGQSAMVPIVSSGLSPRKDLIYNGLKMPTHPVATLRFKNSTSLTLERGPVTVLENGEYMGEAVLPFTADQAEAVISYAVELGVHIKEEHRSDTQLHSLQIREGYLLQQIYDIQRTRYLVDNRTAQPKTILIERAINHHFQVFDSPEAFEKTLDSRRYKVEVGPGKTGELMVQERHMRAQREELRKLSYQGLQRYFENQFLDKKSYEGLKALLDVWAEISRLEQVIAEQNQRREQTYRSQEQIQKNMAALSKEGEEGRLRGRYVKQLTSTEEVLAEIDQILARTRTEIEQKQAQIQQMIAALNTP